MTCSWPGLTLVIGLAIGAGLSAQGSGSIRGVVRDKDFDVPLAGAQVSIADTRQTVESSDLGGYLLSEVPAGSYTLIVSKEGYLRQVKSGVVVVAGQLTELDVSLAGEFTEMEEFVVQDILLMGAGSEQALLQLRADSSALIDSIGSDLMSKAGASDAAVALKLVSGASLQNGKSAVIRGLPDRYVSSQMNSLRLPSADEDKRAVELDQFPAAVIESIQVSKTFTPDQQGDASGGAVDVRLRGIPKETIFTVKAQLGYNSQAAFSDDFLTYEGGSFDFLGHDDGNRHVQPDGDWSGAVGATEGDAPIDYKLGLDAGTQSELADGVKIGAFASVFYERDSAFIDDGRDDALWRVNPGDPLTPEFGQGSPDFDDFKTALLDYTQSTESVRLGGLATVGIESERNALDLTYLYTRNTANETTVATDTRGKEFFFPGHDPNDPTTPGHAQLNAAPYIRTDTLEFTERTVDTLQLRGRHTLPYQGFEVGSALHFGAPELDWALAHSSASMDQPDKRQFAAIWQPFGVGLWSPYKPAASFRLGNLQRTFKELEEESNQHLLDLKLPFEQWNDLPGYLKFGLFDERVERAFDQESFSNFDDNTSFVGGFDQPWSVAFEDENHVITGSTEDVDYDGDQEIQAWYAMVDTPVTDALSIATGLRFESTDISTVVDPEDDATWLNPDSITNAPEQLEPGEADAQFDQDDVLPALGVTYKATDPLTFRAAYSETVARQTFKELTPILQQDFVGAPIFVGNPDLRMSNLKNYDLRVDYTPREGSFFSASWFHKDIEDPIEYVQRVFTFSFTQPTNYPEGTLSGYELEVRESLASYSESLEGFSVGANATFIDSEVVLPDDEQLILANHEVPQKTRNATNAPEYLYNLYLIYELEKTQIGLFYSVQGDTLLAGAGAASAGTSNTLFVPSVFQEEIGTLNLTISHQLQEHVRLKFEAKNLTDPSIETVYRSDFIGSDVTKSSYSTGREFSFSLSFNL